VLLDDLFTDGQPYAGTSELFPPVQPLEHAEYLFEVLGFNSQSVVLHRELPLFSAVPAGGDVYLGNSGPLVLNGIVDKVLK